MDTHYDTGSKKTESTSIHSKTRHKPQLGGAFTRGRDPHVNDHTRVYKAMSSMFQKLEMMSVFAINTVIMWL